MSEQIRVLPTGHQPIAECKQKPMPVSFRKSTTSMQMQASGLRRQGVSVCEIAEQLGVSRSLVYIWLRTKKVVRRKVVPQPKRLRIKAETTTTMPSESSSGRAKIVFPSGIALEMPVASLSGEFIRVLSEIR